MLLVGYSYKRPFMRLKLRLIFWDNNTDSLTTKELDREMVSTWIVGGTYSIGQGICKKSGKDTELMDKFKTSLCYEEYRASEYINILMSELGDSL